MVDTLNALFVNLSLVGYVMTTPFPLLDSIIAPTAPVTEIWLTYFDANGSAAARDKYAASVGEFLEKTKNNSPHYTSVGRGWTPDVVSYPLGEEGEKAHLYAVTLGWESKETHLEARETALFKDNIGLVQGHEGQLKSRVVHYKGILFEKRD